MIKKLSRQGYFKEMPHGETSDPSIKDYVGLEHDTKLKERICEYLNSGVVIVACYGNVTDVIIPEKGTSGCPCMMTDGKWVWPGDLPYYISEYSLRINTEFLTTMELSNWVITITEDDIDFDSLEIDGRKLIE